MNDDKELKAWRESQGQPIDAEPRPPFNTGRSSSGSQNALREAAFAVEDSTMSTDTLSEAGLEAAELVYGRLIDAAKSIEAYDKITDAQRCEAIIRAYLATSQEAAAPSEESVAQLGGAPDDLHNLIKVVFADMTIEQMGEVCKEVIARRSAPYASPAVAPVAVGVKPIEWDEDEDDDGSYMAKAHSLGFDYVIDDDGIALPPYTARLNQFVIGRFDTIEAAKAAAQADFNARILSSIIPATKEGLLPAVEVHPADTLPSGPAHLVSKAYVHEGCAIALYGTNDKLIGWIDTHEWVNGRIYRHHFLSQGTDTEVKP